MVLRFLGAGMLLFLTSCGGAETKPLAADSEEFEHVDAKSLYILHCEACHGLDGAKGTSGAANLAASRKNEKEIKDMILHGNDKGMMPYEDIITSKEQINSLVEYVKTLQK